MGTQLKHITFSIDGPVDKFDWIENLVKEHDITEYLISHEMVCDKNIPHYHFIILTNEKTYANFIKKLRNALNAYKKTTGRGGYSPYQRVKQPIQDLQKLKVYCSKEGNVRSTYSEEVLKDLYDQSFMKSSKDRFKSKLLEYLDSSLIIHPDDYDLKQKLYKQILHFIINYDSICGDGVAINEDFPISRSGIITWGNYYVRKTLRWSPNQKKNILYNLLFN